MDMQIERPEIAPEILTASVRGLCRRPMLDITGWQIQALHSGTGHATGELYRLTGTGQDQGEAVDWSMILKVLSPHATRNAYTAADDPSHALYWKREALAYQSGMLADLPGGLSAPRCVTIDEQPNGDIRLWLEEAHDRYGPRWPLDQYARAARCLGRFNGAYLTGRPLPTYSWLGRPGSLRGMLEGSAWVRSVLNDSQIWNQPAIQQAFPIPITHRLLRLWDERERFLAALDRMPQTLCHKDFWRANLFAPLDPAQDNALIVIDWAVVGIGELAMDAGDLFGASWHRFGVDSTDLRVFDTTIFENYLVGLKETGLHVDRWMVRVSYTGFAALKYGCVVLAILLSRPDDEHWRAHWERLTGQSLEAVFTQQAALSCYLLDLIDEAHNLLTTG